MIRRAEELVPAQGAMRRAFGWSALANEQREESKSLEEVVGSGCCEIVAMEVKEDKGLCKE